MRIALYVEIYHYFLKPTKQLLLLLLLLLLKSVGIDDDVALPRIVRSSSGV